VTVQEVKWSAHILPVPAEADDGLSCNKGDTIEVMQSETDRWYVRNSDGMLGCQWFIDIRLDS
jgi:hypothetical protein